MSFARLFTGMCIFLVLTQMAALCSKQFYVKDEGAMHVTDLKPT